MLNSFQKFQSYLTGIEMLKRIHNSFDFAKFQSYLTGIEISSCNTLEILPYVPIVPNWN